MRQIACLAALALAPHARAAPYQFDLSGEQFAALLAAQPVSERQYRARERAYSYMDGAKDAAIGTAWCPARPHKTAELAYAAADYIKGLPAEQRRGNAAHLLLAYLSQQYPCKEAQR